jgi:hypothetical protein
MSNQTKNIEALTRPISPEEIEWRIVNKPSEKNKYKMSVAPYIDSRCVMERFDEAFGWDGWSDSLLVTPDGKGMIITVEVNTAAGRIQKSDSVTIDHEKNKDVDAMKTAASDAIKRVAVKFGVGRDLYNYPKVAIQVKPTDSDKYMPSWAATKLSALVKDVIDGKVTRNFVTIEEGGSKPASNQATVEQPKTEPATNTKPGKPVLSDEQFASMLIYVNSGKWAVVEKEMKKYEMDTPKKNALEKLIATKKQEAVVENAKK